MRSTDEGARKQRPHPERVFWWLWSAVLLAKVLIAARLPLFVDEAFYWQEGRHLAPAYSDLPGLTAWLARIGVAIGGEHALALRAPFLLLSALTPWLLARMAVRASGPERGWTSGCFALLLPLAGTLGLMAMPDVVLALATVLCLDAGVRLLRRVEPVPVLELALGLVLGALSHYRFIAVIGVGVVALLLLPEGRRALRDVRVWVAIAAGAFAWAPLIAWNLDNADAGLRFQLVDRHPWAFHPDGILFIAVQALLVTPVLFVALLLAGAKGLRTPHSPTRFLALAGALIVAGFFLLGFFADNERVSFHWPLPGYLALLPLLPGVIERWPRGWRSVLWITSAIGLAATMAYYMAVSTPDLRARAAAHKAYPSNFAGWDALADAVKEERSRMPPGTRVLADNFKIGAELGFALGDPDIPVLDHPLNHKHGRAPQLRLWGLTPGRSQQGATSPTLLVVGITDVPYKHLLKRYHDLCAMVGPLPPPRVIDIDHGRRRFALFRLEGRRAGPCTAPAMAWIDMPVAGAEVGRTFEVRGWAFKDGVGLEKIEALVDGRVVASIPYGHVYPDLDRAWPLTTDPQHPQVGFAGTVDLRDAKDLAPGRHWLGLRLYGNDGSVEDWPEQAIEVLD